MYGCVYTNVQRDSPHGATVYGLVHRRIVQLCSCELWIWVGGGETSFGSVGTRDGGRIDTG